MHYEVQHYTLAHGWKNTWYYIAGDGVFQLETFATRDEAEAALDEYFGDLADEFRVEFVSDTTTELNNQPTGETL
jgi:hypothetical protein